MLNDIHSQASEFAWEYLFLIWLRPGPLHHKHCKSNSAIYENNTAVTFTNLKDFLR